MNSSEECYNATGYQFCNVTVTWTPRVSEVGGILAMVIPALYVVVMLGVTVWLFNKKGMPSASGVRRVYQNNVKLMNLRTCKIKATDITMDYEQIKTRIKNKQLDTEIEVEWLHVGTTTLRDVEAARNHRKLLGGLITLPRYCGKFSIVSKLILLPFLAAAWDVVDVVFDTYYFYKLERGGLINSMIYRNSHVNDGILALACLGAIKNALVIHFSLGIVFFNGEMKYHDRTTIICIIYKLCVFVFKVLLEDAPEMVLEYFYVDKFIVENPPWFLVGKDVVTALLYVIPLYEILSSGRKDLKEISHDLDDIHCNISARVFYILVTIGRASMSLAMIFRIVGMIAQYSSNTVNKECFVLLDNALVQTPFTIGCFVWYDWVISTLLSLTLLTLIPAAFYAFTEDMGFMGMLMNL